MGSVTLQSNFQKLESLYDYTPYGSRASTGITKNISNTCTGNPPWLSSNPQTNLWTKRDPIEEKDGLNLYAMVRNNVINKWDLLGYKIVVHKLGPYKIDGKILNFEVGVDDKTGSIEYIYAKPQFLPNADVEYIKLNGKIVIKLLQKKKVIKQVQIPIKYDKIYFGDGKQNGIGKLIKGNINLKRFTF